MWFDQFSAGSPNKIVGENQKFKNNQNQSFPINDVPFDNPHFIMQRNHKVQLKQNSYQKKPDYYSFFDL